MKKALLLFFVLIFSENSVAQSWGAPGAEWHYRVDYPWLPYQDGYMKVTITSTFTQNNLTHYNLKGTFFGQVNSVNFPTVALSYFNAITYQDHEVLFVYNQTTASYDTIANFKANIGDTWRMTQRYDQNQQPCTFPRPVITVIDTDHVVINSLNLKRLKLLLPVNGTTYTMTMVEKIGGIDGPMYPYFMCISDSYKLGNFVCYSDNNFPLYQNPGYNLPCDFTTVGKDEFTLEGLELNVFPNPAAEKVKIEFSGENSPQQVQLIVHDLLGREVLTQNLGAGSDLDLTQIPQGLYQLSLFSENQLLARRKLLKSTQE